MFSDSYRPMKLGNRPTSNNVSSPERHSALRNNEMRPGESERLNATAGGQPGHLDAARDLFVLEGYRVSIGKSPSASNMPGRDLGTSFERHLFAPKRASACCTAIADYTFDQIAPLDRSARCSGVCISSATATGIPALMFSRSVRPAAWPRVKALRARASTRRAPGEVRSASTAAISPASLEPPCPPAAHDRRRRHHSLRLSERWDPAKR